MIRLLEHSILVGFLLNYDSLIESLPNKKKTDGRICKATFYIQYRRLDLKVSASYMSTNRFLLPPAGADLSWLDMYFRYKMIRS